MIGRAPKLLLVAALATALAGCDVDWSDPDDQGPDYVSVCTTQDGTRVDDDHCDPRGSDNTGSFVWFYYAGSSGANVAPVGQRVDRSSGVSRLPIAGPGGKAPVVARGGSVPSGGGVVQRGGLGVTGGKAGGSSGGSAGS